MSQQKRRPNPPKGYENLEFLGEGGFKITYEAWDSVAKRRVALKEYKELSKEKLILLEQKEGMPFDIMKERDLIPASLEHKNVLPCEWAFNSEDELWIIEPLLDIILNEVLKIEGRLYFDDFYVLGKGIIEGIRYIHEKGYVHADLKLDNIGVKEATPKICDFGIASILSPERRFRYNPGTIRTRPPELFKEGVYPTFESDIWAIGSILFALVVGEYPFISKEEEEIMPPLSDKDARKEFEEIIKKQVLESKDKIDKIIERKVPQLYWDIIKSCLRYKPEDRINPKNLIDKIDELKKQVVDEIIKDIEDRKDLYTQLEEKGSLIAYDVIKTDWDFAFIRTYIYTEKAIYVDDYFPITEEDYLGGKRESGVLSFEEIKIPDGIEIKDISEIPDEIKDDIKEKGIWVEAFWKTTLSGLGKEIMETIKRRQPE